MSGSGQAGGVGERVARWLPPTDERTPINVHPEALKKLLGVLYYDDTMQGVGYSEFIYGAVDAFLKGQWHPRAALAQEEAGGGA